MMTETETDRELARKRLLEILKPGDTVTTVLRHVTASGMTRHIDVYKMGEDPEYLSWFVAKVIGEPVNVGKHDGVKIGGCGMDMGFELVYRLGRALWPDGYPCTGDQTGRNRRGRPCGAPEHVNGPNPDRDYTPGHAIHADGGYALNQRWL